MDFRVGNTPPIGPPADRSQRGDGSVEARLLAVRAPRRRADGIGPEKDRRQSRTDRDPPSGRVLVLLIPDASRLPDGLESGAYRVFLRFARR